LSLKAGLAIKLAVLLVGMTSATCLVVYGFSARQESEIVSGEIQRDAMLLADTIDHAVAAAMLSERKEIARDLADNIARIDPIQRVVIFDSHGRVWHDARRDGAPEAFEAASIVPRVAATGKIEFARSGAGNRETYAAFSPIIAEGACFRCHAPEKNLGVVGIVMSPGAVQSRLAADRRFRLAVGLAAAAVAIVLFGILVTWLVVGRLRRLAGVASAIAAGHLGRRAKVEGNDEIADLARAFNTMSDRLAREVRSSAKARVELQAAIERIGEAIGSAHQLPDLIGVLTHEAVRVSQAEAAVIFFFDERDELRAAGARAVAAKDLDNYNRAPFWRDDAIVVAQSRRLLDHSDFDPATDLDRARLAILPGARCQFAAPISHAGSLLGFISVVSRHGCRLSDDARRLLFALAAQAGLAIQQIRSNERTREFAITDGLTGLRNHRHFRERLIAETERAKRFAHPLALIMLDVDNFKSFNDRFGHPAGDAVLRHLGRVLEENTRQIDVAARYGGEEFAVLLVETSLAEALRFAERLRKVVHNAALARAAGLPGEVTISVGVAAMPEHAEDADGLVAAADTCLYAAKAAGRDCVISAPASAPGIDSRQ